MFNVVHSNQNPQYQSSASFQFQSPQEFGSYFVCSESSGTIWFLLWGSWYSLEAPYRGWVSQKSSYYYFKVLGSL